MSIEAEQALFDACLATSDPAARERLLDSHADAAVATRVRRLLRAHESEADSLARTEWALESREIGPFRLLERIGEGAIGEVWMAEQLRPVRRRVAVKILKAGLGTREVLARFELERQALALMTHPNVARIFDAGTLAEGRPWFAMEFMPGVAITEYCDLHRLDLPARLALFKQVCAGVQHAHLRGVIHRDLKPSNILVADVDGVMQPKIIDFGIAKATTPVADASDPHTRVGHVLGTPEYMSPEQAQLSPLDVDARTDIYSLGMLLYELLTGTRPYRVTRDSFDPSIIARDIRDGEVRRPSLQVAQEDAESVAWAAARGLTPRQLASRLRGDLDWIVLKTLEKDRQRRYSSIGELVADLDRSERNEPVTAGPPSVMYTLGKFVRRHRMAVVVGVSLVVASLAFGAGMAVLAQRAAREAEVARRVTAFTAGLFSQVDPARAGGQELTARQLLDAGVERLESEFDVEREDVQAALLEAAANAYRGLGEYEKAEPLIERAVALRSAASADPSAARALALHSQAALARARGDYPQAEARLRSAERELQGMPNPDPATQLAIELELAQVLRLRSHLVEAEQLAHQIVARCEQATPVDAACLSQALATLGRIETDRGDLSLAVTHLERALELSRRAFGDTDPRTAYVKEGLGFALVNQGRSAEAEPLLREILEDMRRLYGPNHPVIGVTLTNLGNALSDLDGRIDEAEQVYLESVSVLRVNAKDSGTELATSLNNLGSLYLKQKRWSEARDAYAEARALRLASLGREHPDTIATQMGEALALNKLEAYDEAEVLLRGAVASFTTQLGRQHWRTANAQMYHGLVLTNLGRYREARTELIEAEQSLSTALGADHYRTVAARKALADLDTRSPPVAGLIRPRP